MQINTLLKNTIYAGCLSVVCMSATYAKNWNLSPQSDVGFSINSLGLNVVQGEFEQFKASMQFDPQQPHKAATEFTMQVDSLALSKPSLRNMVMGEDLFHASRYATVNFKSTQFKPNGTNRYQVLGQLTLRGVTRPVVFDTVLTPDQNNPHILTVNSTTVIKRSDFGMKKAMAGVGEKVNIHLKGQWQAL